MGEVRIRLHGMTEDIDEFLSCISICFNDDNQVQEYHRNPVRNQPDRVIQFSTWTNPNV
jgi:hypothetical protein